MDNYKEETKAEDRFMVGYSGYSGYTHDAATMYQQLEELELIQERLIHRALAQLIARST